MRPAGLALCLAPLRWPVCRRHAAAALVAVVCTVYHCQLLDRGWIPHDEGQLGHTAERILQGELPHRDFVDPYTGGLGLLDAAAFRLIGVRASATRWAIVPFFALFIWCAYSLAARVTSAASAALAAILCGALSLPIYPAGMPSWFNLFFAVYGTTAICCFQDTGRRRWLVLAGACGGGSILFKITGLYFVAAGLLYLLYLAASQSASQSRRSPLYSAAVSAALLLFGSLSLFFVHGQNPLASLYHTVIPFVALSGSVAWHEWQVGRGRFVERCRGLASLCGPFLGGVLLVGVPFLASFAWAGGLDDLLYGALVLPQRRLSGAQMAFPAFCWTPLALPLGVLLLSGFRLRGAATRWAFWIVLVIGSLLLSVSHGPQIYWLIFQALRHSIPIVVMAGLVTVHWLFRQPGNTCRREQRVMWLTSIAFFVSLIQFPYAGGFYFFYAAPVAVLAALYTLDSQPNPPRLAAAATAALILVFLIVRMHWPGPAITGGPYDPNVKVRRIELPRCRLAVPEADAKLYTELVSLIAARTDGDAFILAVPDCPEVYFLSGRRNPLPNSYALFQAENGASPSETVRQLRERGVRMAVVKCSSEFSTDAAAAWLAACEHEFAHRRVLTGPDDARTARFVAFWRDDCPRCDGHAVAANR